MANATSTQLQELYVAYFGRAADPTGLDYWTEKGITTSKFASDMYAQAEFKDVYGSLSTEAQVNQIYKNLFDREADVTGLNYWTLQINLGNLKLAEIATHLIWAAQNNSDSSDDKTALSNRTDAAVAYTAKVKESTAAILAFQAESTSPWKAGDNITEAITYLSGIDKDTAYTAAGIASSVTTITNNGPSGNKKTFSLTSGVDSGASFTGGSSADVFNANLDTNSSNTLNAFDELVGGGGVDKLYADIKTAVTPLKLTGIEEINATFTGAVTFGIANATDATSVSNVSSTSNATFTGLAASATALSVENVASSTTSFGYLSTTGTQASTVTVNNVTGGTAGEISVDGIETLTFNGSVSASSYEIAADAATTLNFGGAADQTVVLDATTLSVSKFDASSATGDLTLTGINQTGVGGATDLSVIGGAGNDSFTLTANTSQDLSVAGGAGDDTITNTALAITDSVDGGTGTDTIITNNAVAIVLDNATRTTFTNVEAITVNDHFDGSLSTQLIATSIDTVNLTLADGNIINEAETITGGAGEFTVNLGNSSSADANGVLGAALTVTDTGSATSDSLTVANKAKTSAGANLDMFGGTAFTSTGYENVTINTGSGTGVAQVDITTLTITPDVVTGTAVSLTLTGTNSIDLATSLTTTATGLMTVDASGLSAQAVGTDTLVITSTSQGTDGTASITGTAGEDTITVGNFKSTIVGGDGADTLKGGTAIDNIQGGAGNDTIDGGGGNDTLTGGAGNDSFTVSGTSVNVDAGSGDDTVNMDGTLTSGDTVVGGLGTDVFAIDTAAATASSSEGVSGFETLRVDAEMTQDMVQFTNNSTFTKLISNVAGTVSFTNVGASVTEFGVLDQAASDTTSFDRLLDNTSNSLSVYAVSDAATSIISLTVDDEETLTIDDGAFTTAKALVITDLHAEDLVTLNITGGSNFTITNAIQAQATAYLTTIDASANTGTVSIDADNATLALTMTGSATAANTLSGGSGGDTITGGSAADTLTGDAGNDSITGAAGADTITGGSGADTISAGAGDDIINGGAGIDSITGGAGADTFRLFNVASIDVVTDFDASQTDLIALDISDIEGLTLVTDFVELDATEVAAATGTVLSIDATAAYDLDGNDTAITAAAFQSNYSSAADLQADIRANITCAATFAAKDGFLVFYDDGTNTTGAIVTTAAGKANAVLSDAVVTDIFTLNGVSDATSIVSANLTTFTA